MRTPTSLALVALASAFFGGATAHREDQLKASNQMNNAVAESSRRVHTVGDVWMNVGSDGRLGTYALGIGAAPDSMTAIPVSCEFPGGSRREYLFGAGLWIGGILGGTDTVVVRSMLATSSSSRSFEPTSPMLTDYDSLLGHQFFTANYADTSYTRDYDFGTANPSLGLEIRQTSHAFESRAYDRSVIVEYLIRNISKETIRNVRVGFFADPDVFSETRINQIEAGPRDDVTGFIRTKGIAYTIDNDGDAWLAPSPSDPSWCPGAFGLAPITIDPIPCCTTFNWWATNWGNLEWGPHRKGSIQYTSWERMLPEGSSAMYRSMANGEIDYDQIEAAIDKQKEGWEGPSISGADNIANGLDTRWTLAYGFQDLYPNDSLRLVMAYVVGDSVHTQPGHVLTPRDPDSYRRELDFSDLRLTVDNARFAWANQFRLEYPSVVGLQSRFLSDRSVYLSWRPSPSPDVEGYRLLKRKSGEPVWSVIKQFNETGLAFADDKVEVGQVYEYAVESRFLYSDTVAQSRTIKVRMGVPRGIPAVRARNTPQAIQLEWANARADSGFSTHALLNVYRKTSDTGQFAYYRSIPLARRTLAGTAEPARAPVRRDHTSMSPIEFIDDSVSLGVMYHYRASVTNDFGIEGPLSNSDSAMPMAFDRKGLILLATQSTLVNLDTLRAFYGTWAASMGFDTLTPAVARSHDPNEPPRITYDVSVALLARYRCVIFVSENPGHSESISPTFYTRIEQYMTNGGKVVFVTRNQGMLGSSGDTVAIPIVEKYLGVRGAQVERAFTLSGSNPNFRVHVKSYFCKAVAASGRYPTIEADSILGWSVPGIWTLPFDDTSMTAGRILEVGTLGPVDTDSEILYRYLSAYDSTIYDGEPIAVKRITDSSAGILFNFPLSLMKHEQAWQALTQAVADLGVDTMNYWSADQLSTQHIIEWLYGHPTGNPDPAWDINRDGVIDIRDVVEVMKR